MNLLFRTLETQRYDAIEQVPVQVQTTIPVKNTTNPEFEIRDAFSSTITHEEIEKKNLKEPVSFVFFFPSSFRYFICSSIISTFPTLPNYGVIKMF